ncbi:pyridoxal phosphate-dependent aminotransferase [Devosia sp. YIM 151766]|uniref:pyridoxal phosphate-dependent aminotransferase n=1 Tax=Devosia sp. YIM 151766 TaxID=3017325 RepID=UPI00255C814A|nr:pyridoxal phosphate-dependent aminotransferase [Devosia sp. YIM 151766]WIY52717.1 pyridoxal phosphate-dependent aminotransferase [Devosia sp. YIM 151766]
MRHLARRITETSKKSFGMYARAAASGRDDLIHMELGKPYADTPQHIKDATIAAIQAGNVHYSDLPGVRHLREAIAEKLQRQNEIDVGADQVVVTNGLTHGSYAAIMAFIDDGDEVILLDPYYPQHVGKVELAGGVPVLAKLDAKNNYAIDAAAIESKITPRTKMIILINPCNPTGRVYSREELTALADLAIKHDLLILSDEVYEEIVYDDARHISIASLPGMADRTISLFAFTKSFAMDGWRIGYLTAPKAAIGAILKITANDVTHVNTFIQEGALAALTGDPEVLAQLVDDDRSKRDRVVTRLNQLPGITCPWPEGTIYAFADVSALGLPSQVLSERLMDEAGVVVESGSFYGAAGEGKIRICFGSLSMEEIDLALDRIADFTRGITDQITFDQDEIFP